MPPPRESIDDKLARLIELDTETDPERARAQIRLALHDRHYRVVAKAASLCAEKLLYDLEADLLTSYPRFLDDPLKRDPNCIAKRAIARALVDLGCNNVTFFLDGVRYQQLEPVWGGSVDTAVDLRCSCAMGLVATGYPRALHELTWLLAEDEANARRGAVRAIACANPKDAELLLRFKVLTGDGEPEVIADCMSALLTLEPEESVPFVARYLEDDNETLQELAALALGESRLPEAFEPLLAAWKETVIPTHFQRVLIRAIALHRSDTAFDWLLGMIRETHSGLITEVVDALPLYARTARHTQRIRIAFEERSDQKMLASFSHLWEQ
jgi:hypothetical protein